MILDTSALTAIVFGEAEVDLYTQIIHDADRCRISAANFVELSMVVEGQIGPDAGRQCDIFFRRAQILIEPASIEQAYLARQAFLDFGNGRHPATGEPLLFKGEDFSKTDIKAADGSSSINPAKLRP